jgi:hypothetical protein
VINHSTDQIQSPDMTSQATEPIQINPYFANCRKLASDIWFEEGGTPFKERDMDIYRFFHPHHNPRLNSTPLRQVELVELEQAASELKKALLRAKLRLDKGTTPPLLPSHMTDIIKAMDFVNASLQTLCDAHPGDTQDELGAIALERSPMSGWETWASLVEEQLGSAKVASANSEKVA